MIQKIKKLLKELKTAPLKRFSQNFLIDQNIINKFIQLIDIDQKTNLIEIGPGLGSITFPLLEKKPSNYLCIEIDNSFAQYLKEQSSKYKNFKIVHTDFLKIDFSKLPNNLHVFGNIPFHITTPIFITLITHLKKISKMTFIIQSDVAERITAIPGTKKYGSLSILLQLYTTPKIEFEISKNAFFPSPKVSSSVITLYPKENASLYETNEGFHSFVQSLFQKRRKQLKTSLKDIYSKETIINTFQKLQLDPSIRIETLSPTQILSLYQSLEKNALIE
ncbi:MAG TPA: 16S rRNA (adenine(1518)-N(6)/adenine(1519)-N(6))-dimethyltransferase RsmA [Chlamydiales bacterium]|nr:16S rRNA (adenine(1518)-N(6)/adenine(1519)-N(6))-dimethyltransferase RsmA [Chlamydiales bacterium]